MTEPMYDKPPPPGSSSLLSPQILSKRSHSNTSSCATITDSSPPSSAPPTPADDQEGGGEEGGGMGRGGGKGDFPFLDETEDRDTRLPDIGGPQAPLAPIVSVSHSEEDHRDPPIADPLAVDPDADESPREADPAAAADGRNEPATPGPVRTDFSDLTSPSDTPRYAGFMEFLQKGVSCGEQEGGSPEAVPLADRARGGEADDGACGDANRECPTLFGGRRRSSGHRSLPTIMASGKSTRDFEGALDASEASSDRPDVPRLDGMEEGVEEGVEEPPPPPRPRYNPAYEYSLRCPADMADFTNVHDTKTKVGRRCYRLNLERPFDIHCEQSPLEYGDYMTPWTKEVYPDTVGPVEYCPPRHLGGTGPIWRELMRWTENSSGFETEVHDERKVNSLDEQEEYKGEDDRKSSLRSSGLGSSCKILSGDSVEYEDLDADGRNFVHPESVGPAARQNLPSMDPTKGFSPTGGWRSLTPQELYAQKKLGERNIYGELCFETYDLSHLSLGTNEAHTLLSGQDVIDAGGADTLRSVFSMDSNASEEERLNPKSPEEMANDTARLFRRSDLSLREAAERERVAEMRKKAEERRKQMESGVVDDLNISQRVRRRAKKGGKAVKKRLSKAFSNPDPNPDVSWRGNAYRQRRSSSASDTARRSSVQAHTIDKARDLIDESDGESGDGLESDGEDVSKKPLNVALYILGEYDILNDLVNDGAKRLRESKEMSDREVLVQNEPCPPPDRWVRNTGWGRCNPSSNYAKMPPGDHDWVRYYDKLRLTEKKGAARNASAEAAPLRSSTNGILKNSSDSISKDSVASAPAQSRASSPPPDLKLTPIPDSPVKAAKMAQGECPAYEGVTTTPTESSTPRGGVPAEETIDILSASARAPRRTRGSRVKRTTFADNSGHGKKTSFADESSSGNEATDILSASARAPRTRRGQGRKASLRSGGDSLSASERVPRARRSSSDSAAAATSGYKPRGYGSGPGSVGSGAGSVGSGGGSASSGYVPYGRQGSAASGTGSGSSTGGGAGPDKLSMSERPRTRRSIIRRGGSSGASSGAKNERGAGSTAGMTTPMSPTSPTPRHDPLSMSERPRTRRGTFRRSTGTAAPPADPLSASERTSRKRLSQRVPKFMRGKSGGSAKE